MLALSLREKGVTWTTHSITASSITQTGMGTSEINGTLTTSLGTGINLTTGGNLRIIGAIVTTNNGATSSLGSPTPLSSLTIPNATTATFGAISAGYLTQVAGTGTTTFNAITTTLPQGISVTGNAFTFQGTVNSAAATILNNGLLTITTPFPLTGSFNQTGTGSVSLAANISSMNESIHFHGPVTLGASVLLNTFITSGDVNFDSSVSGAHDLTIQAGAGSIRFSGAISGLTTLHILSAINFTAQSSTSASSVLLQNITGLGQFQGALSTSGASGISVTGAAFTFVGPITTTNGGPLVISNSGVLTFNPALSLSLSGSFSQSGGGPVTGGGVWTTTQDFHMHDRFILNSDCEINAHGISFDNTLNGDFLLSLTSGTGGTTCLQTIGNVIQLKGFSVLSAQDITLSGVGVSATSLLSVHLYNPFSVTPVSTLPLSSGVSGLFSVSASGNITLHNISYTAKEHFYLAGGTITFDAGQVVSITSFGPIDYQGGTIILTGNTDLDIITNNGSFSFTNLTGTFFENISINAGNGLVIIGNISGLDNNWIVNAGSIRFTAPVNCFNAIFVSQTDGILNAGPSTLISSQNNAYFNALEGDAGSLISPLWVNTLNQIYAGAGSGPPPIPRDHNLANFIGSSVDNTVHAIASNPPCRLIWNGTTLLDCGAPPPPPPPPPPPSAPTTAIPNIALLKFAAPGFDSSAFNLSNDFFFRTFFINEDFFKRAHFIFAR